jgi:hypothetical protein
MLMTPEQIFSLASTLALVGWVVMVIAPHWQHTRALVFSGVVLLLSALYAYLILRYMGAATQNGGGFGSLKEVTLLFQTPEALLAGWIHYLAFDLITGLWISVDAAKRGINRWFTLPFLFLTFMLGPIGLLTYSITRSIVTKRFPIDPFEL